MITTIFRLLFRDVELGHFTREDFDFPNNFGHFHLNKGADCPEIREQILAYVKYSIEADRIGKATDYGEEWTRFMEQNEAQFVELIETSDWYLIASDGKKVGILIPNFCSDNEVVWRYSAHH